MKQEASMVINPTRLKIQSISALSTQLDQTATMATPILGKNTQPKEAPVAGNPSIKGEVQMSGFTSQLT